MRGLLTCIDHQQKGNQGGYGHTKINGKTQYLHRVAYAAKAGIHLDSIHGAVVRHTCDNPRCINPEHLITGTYKDNSQDMLDRGRHWVPTGEQATQSILTREAVLDIRSRYTPRHRVHGCRALGREYGVDNHTISDVVTNKTWRDVL